MSIRRILRDKFCENFKVNHLTLEIMDLVDELDMTADNVLDNFICGQFNENCTYGEIYDIFKDEMSKEDLKSLLENMGHDFVDLDELDEEEREKYY